MMKVGGLALIGAVGMGAMVALAGYPNTSTATAGSENARLYPREAASVAPAACLTLELTPGYVKRTIDGDTFILYSIATPPEERVRVLGVDTPEKGSGPVADSATAFTIRWLADGPFTLTACKRDSFGRLLAIVSRAGRTLADTLVILHLGVPR